jgi:hypothetical protein
MTSRTALLLGLPLVPFVLFAACSNQSEGERCSVQSGTAVGSNDCGDGLVCVSEHELADKTGGDRCCPPLEKMTIGTDSRCLRSTGSTDTSNDNTGGTESGAGGQEGDWGSGGQAGDLGQSGAATGSGGFGTGTHGSGLACNYDAECPGTEVCGPLGRCQWQCLSNKDCPQTDYCDSLLTHACVPTGTGGAPG